MHIGIVTGEASGDILGAALLVSLKRRYPACQFSGIGGERMIAEGFVSLFPQDRLAVMGLIEPLKRLPELLSIRKQLFEHFTGQNVDLLIGIDSPDFTLTLEKNVREQGIKTVHYVSPSVWAWRKGRIKLIKKAVDLMLTLLPFETDIYRQHNVPVAFVGHPLADQFPMGNDLEQSRCVLLDIFPEISLDSTRHMIACLPGSRHGEVERIGPALWESMQALYEHHPDIHILVPALNDTRHQQICEQLEAYPELPVDVVKGHSQQVMAAANSVVMASGTTTLEAMLLKKPMVVVYKKDALSYAIISRLLTVEHISLPNLLAGEALVPELVQDAANPEEIVKAMRYWIENPEAVAALKDKFSQLHEHIHCNASEKAADAIDQLLQDTNEWNPL